MTSSPLSHSPSAQPPGEALKRVARARANLILREPFFGTLLLRLEAREDPACRAVWTDGRSLGVNPAFVATVEENVLEGVLCHEVMHLALGHHLRRGGRHQSRWNAATDYAVNPIVLDAGLELPGERLYDEKFAGMEAERIYELLDREPKQASAREGRSEVAAGSSPKARAGADFGEVRDFPGHGEQELLEELASWESALREAVRSAKAWGRIPASANRLLPELDRSRMNWREILARFMEQASRTDYLWARPNRRYAQSGFCLPTLSEKRFEPLVLIVDTSASISREDLAALASECLGILALYQDSAELTVLYVDCRVAGVQTLSGEDRPLPVGGGGTSYRPGFEHLRREAAEVAGVVYFTDGECADFPDEPDWPVLWVLSRENPWFRHRVPFGEVVALKTGRERVPGRKS
jgi:predicted metal-dependent peptidase